MTFTKLGIEWHLDVIVWHCSAVLIALLCVHAILVKMDKVAAETRYSMEQVIGRSAENSVRQAQMISRFEILENKQKVLIEEEALNVQRMKEIRLALKKDAQKKAQEAPD